MSMAYWEWCKVCVKNCRSAISVGIDCIDSVTVTESIQSMV